MTNNNESLNDNNDAIVNESENNSEIVDSIVDKENIPEKINYLDPEILNVKKYTYEQLMEQTDDEKLISDDAELYSNDDFSNISEKQLVQGTIVAVNDKEVLVDIGFKSEGVIDKNEFKAVPHVGEEVEIFLVVFEDKRGRLILSKERADFESRWKELREASENDTILTGKIIKIIKGGLVVDLGVVNAFLPGSQLDVAPVSNFEEFLNKECDFKIVKFNEFRQNIVVSRKATMIDDLADKRNELLENLEVNSTVEGTVKNITDFGVFIDLGGGIDGLLHITDLTWGRINHPSDKLAIGDKINVKVIDYDKVKNRISLGLKQLLPDPWIEAMNKYQDNAIIEGKIVNMMNYGVFVEIEDGIEGLIHISEISWTKHIKHPSEIYKVGDVVKAMVISIDDKTKKISLGIKQMSDNPWTDIEKKYTVGDKCNGSVVNLIQNGAFISLDNNIEGFLHINDISWTRRIKNSFDILSKNEKLDLVISEVSAKDKKINLSLKNTIDDPWLEIDKYYSVDQKINASVLHILEKGIIFLTSDNFECILPMSKIVDKSIFEYNKSFDLIISEINLTNRRIVLNLESDNQEKLDSKKNDSDNEVGEAKESQLDDEDLSEEKLDSKKNDSDNEIEELKEIPEEKKTD